MDTEIVSNPWSRDELERAHQHYMDTAARCAASGDWRDWADLFTDDALYLEHTFGTFHGPEEIYEWITPLMAEWPNQAMNAFPHAWCVCDEQRGWWICRIENRMKDPGDGSVHQAHNITVLHYAGDMKFSYEEDAYNPASFGPMIAAWTEAARRQRGRAVVPSRSMTDAEVRAFLTASPACTGKLATIRADGRPHLAPVWYDVDDDGLLVFNTGEATVKGRNLRRDPRASLCVDDERPPFSFVVVDGVAEISDDLDEVRRWAARIGGRYMGAERAEEYGTRNGLPGELLVRLRPERTVSASGVAD